jgi:hypothetical protein
MLAFTIAGAWSTGAAAHDVERPTAADRAGDGHSAPAAPEGRTEGGGGEEKEERKFFVGLDAAIGWGKVPFSVQNLPTTGTQAITYTRSDTRSHVQSFVLAFGWEASDRLELGARLPFSFGTFMPDGAPSRSSSSIGNLELEAEYPMHPSERLELGAALGVALPTGQGTQIPDLNGTNAASVDEDSYDRFSLARASALARGAEDNALFEPRHFGIIPRVGAVYRAGSLKIEPSVKVENLIATSSTLPSYVGELVPALRVGYGLDRFELVLRGWVNVGFAGGAEDKTTSGAVEPDVAVATGPLRAWAGLMVPVAGPAADAGFLAVRLGVSGRF